MNISVPLLKNSSGKESASFTLVFITFNVIILWLLMYIFKGVTKIEVPDFSGSDSMMLISPLLTLYFVGKNKSSTEE